MKSLTEILGDLTTAEDVDTAYIIAATINLYSEALRRKHGRILYSPTDAKRLFELCNLVLTLPEPVEVRPVRSTLNEEERETVLSAVAKEVLPNRRH